MPKLDLTEVEGLEIYKLLNEGVKAVGGAGAATFLMFQDKWNAAVKAEESSNIEFEVLRRIADRERAKAAD